MRSHRGALSSILSALLCIASSASAQISIRQAYPAVWDLTPSSVAMEHQNVRLRWLPDGDVLVEYRSHAVSFFSRREFRSTEDAFGGKYPPPDGRHRVTLPNGRIVVSLAQQECARGLGSQLIVRDKSENVVVKKSLLVVLDQPRLNPTVQCEEEQEAPFRSSVVILRPVQLLPLSDNTFLVTDMITGIVLRLDADLNSRSDLIGRRVFFSDPGELEQLAYKYARPSPQYGLDWVRFFGDLRAKLTKTESR